METIEHCPHELTDIAAPHKPSRLKMWFANLVFASAWVLIIIGAYWSLYPYKPIEILDKPMDVPNKIVKIGEVLTYHADYCKNMNLPSTVTRSFVDGVKYDLPPVNTDNPTGCHELYPALIVPNIPPGVYHLLINYQYQVNPIRTITVQVVTENFTIIK
jgi:hypothetical protein